VLLVDDDADVLVMLQAVLTSRTIDVVGLATSGEDALRVASAIAPDVAVVDYMITETETGLFHGGTHSATSARGY